ncbi:hypothetical protein BDK51DRAFT_44698 [Blyttiomyces helicus]|uniref:Uncharacterized protein n=1 Tax=Blyttiomyces helicus TaxID=388810 RepID=A0A4P9WIV5_9FUNG|nr:hypothetical protein BDK51DRAFT_44698 [Blyttiomyces helicus]|eukprot:RKO91843.1 hypothetical protein BDK51DRAFT_44698 [Blyttiomyces helicus]
MDNEIHTPTDACRTTEKPWRVGKILYPRTPSYVLHGGSSSTGKGTSSSVATPGEVRRSSAGPSGQRNSGRGWLEAKELQSLNRPPIRYDGLDPFRDRAPTGEDRLQQEFLEAFGRPKLEVMYIDDNTTLRAIWKIRRFRDGLQCTQSEILHLDVGQRLVSIKGSMPVEIGWESFDVSSEWFETSFRYTMYLCELDLPDRGHSVCCVVDIKSATIAEDESSPPYRSRVRTRIVDAGPNVAGSETGSAQLQLWGTVECLVFRMENLDNIGDFYREERLVSKKNTCPLYRDTNVVDPTHAHWYRKVRAKERSAIVESIVRNATGKGGFYVEVPV